LIEADTADFHYARLQRMTESEPTGYGAKALGGFVKLIEGWDKDSYIFMINGAKVRAPAAAMALQQRLGIAKV